MNELRMITDRLELADLRTEFADAATLRDHDRLVGLFTEDAAYRIPDAGVDLSGREAIRAGTHRLAGAWEYFLQTTQSGPVRLDGDIASGRSYTFELGRLRDGRSVLNHALFHDRYRRTPDGWRFTERVYEVRYFDTTPLAGAPTVDWPDSPHVADPATSRPEAS